MRSIYEKLYYAIHVHMKEAFGWDFDGWDIVFIISMFTSMNYISIEFFTSFYISSIPFGHFGYHVTFLGIYAIHLLLPAYFLIYKSKHTEIVQKFEKNRENYQTVFLKYIGITIILLFLGGVYIANTVLI